MLVIVAVTDISEIVVCGEEVMAYDIQGQCLENLKYVDIRILVTSLI